MKEETRINIKQFCKEHNVILINIRSIKNKGKSRIVLTLRCKQCKTRFDIRWESLKQQKYIGFCTSCAHKECAKERALDVDKLIKRFTDEGFQVLTPKNKIKRRGKRSIYFTPIDITNKYGDIFTVNCNNFCSNIERYRLLSENPMKDMYLNTKSSLEFKVRQFLLEQNIPFKQEFRFMNCRGKKYPLPFDFCLFYNQDNILLIEVDGQQHFNNGGLFEKDFEQIQERDNIKTKYCKAHNIPLLRISYKSIYSKNEEYKNMIINFIQNNQ